MVQDSQLCFSCITFVPHAYRYPKTSVEMYSECEKILSFVGSLSRDWS